MRTAERIIAYLADFAIRVEHQSPTETRYRCNSPLRPNSDSQSFVLTVRADGEHGCYYDHVTGEHGSLYDLARRLHLSVSAPPSSTSRVLGVDEYAAAHGITAQVLFDAGWRVTVRNGRTALAIPTTTGLRYRYLDGNKPKFDHAHGYTPCWYRLEEAIALAAQTNSPLVLCNGEPSVVAAQWYGVPATCITSSGERPLPPKLLEELLTRWPGPLIVALDSDTKGRDAAGKLVAQLTEAGRPAVAVDLGGWEGYDLADFCRDYGQDALARLRERARAAYRTATQQQSAAAPAAGGQAGLLRVYWGEEMETIPAPVDLVRGYLMVGTVALLIAPPESGKSTVAVDLACRVAQHHHVLYVAAEAGSNVRMQVAAWQRYHGGSIHRLGLVIDPINLLNPDHLDALRATMMAHAVRLVVIDTLSAAAPELDENSSAVAALIAQLNELARATSCTLLLLHHPTKSNSTVYRGHSSLLANTHTAMIIERASPDDPLIKLSVIRHRGMRAEPAWFQLTPVELADPYGRGTMTVPVIVPSAKRRSDILTAAHYAVLEYLADLGEEGATTGEITTDLGHTIQCSAATLRAVIADLLRAGLITADGGGRRAPKVLTARGQQVLAQRDDARAAQSQRCPFEITTDLPVSSHAPVPAPMPPAPDPDPTPDPAPNPVAVVIDAWRQRLPAGWGLVASGQHVAIVAPTGKQSPWVDATAAHADEQLARCYGKLLAQMQLARPPMAD